MGSDDHTSLRTYIAAFVSSSRGISVRMQQHDKHNVAGASSGNVPEQASHTHIQSTMKELPSKSSGVRRSVSMRAHTHTVHASQRTADVRPDFECRLARSSQRNRQALAYRHCSAGSAIVDKSFCLLRVGDAGFALHRQGHINNAFQE